ncbi:MAG: GNAT family N-acetyltransferase [Hyphococcus sp.]
MTAICVRPVRREDASGLNAIYNAFIRESPATFEMREHTLEQREAWITEHAGNPAHPVFAAISDGAVCGFASASPFDPREGYASSVKTSVFVSPAAAGKSVGKALYAALFDALERTAIHRAYALIVAPNPASAALHRAFGFAHVATLSEVGCKFGRYWDVMWFEKRFCRPRQG